MGLAPDDKWWYLACGACKKKAIPHGDSYRCTKCPNKTAEPRYSIFFRNIMLCRPSCLTNIPINFIVFIVRYKLAVESTDHTSIIEFIFFGDIAE